MIVSIKKLNPAAQIPKRNTPTDAGYDLCAIGSYCIPSGGRILVKTGLAVEIPEGLYGRIAPRSGLALKHGIDVLAGVLDSGYRNEVGIVLVNLGGQTFTVNEGDRIAQLIIEKCYDANFVETDVLPDSVRGENGFGSSGV
jgi:dUTP pyrophosphatase